MHSPDAPDIRPLAVLLQRLRAPDGCPWDRAQDHRSLQRYLLEECHECLHAIDALEEAAPADRGAAEAAFRDELGDLLLQVVFHAQLADERGAFSLQDVITSIHDKMVRRHPHVFGEERARDAAEVARIWDDAKAQERAQKGTPPQPQEDPLALPPGPLPALHLAQRVGARAARAGLDWEDATGVLEKVEEERDELAEAFAGGDPRRIEEELGDLLLALASFARHCGLEAEDALRRAIGRFLRRGRQARTLGAAEGVSLAEALPAVVHAYWKRAKALLQAEEAAATQLPPTSAGSAD